MPLELNGFKAWIECDGKELEAYAAETSVNGEMISGWIASETGKRFVFQVGKATGNSESFTGKAYMSFDGLGCGAVLFHPLDKVNRVHRKEGLRISDAAVLPFIFAALESTESHPVPVQGHLGELKVSIWRAEVVAEPNHDRAWHKAPMFEPINETKGVITHRVSFAAPIPNTLPKRDYRHKTVGKAPMARFIFNYRSKEVLRAKGMILTPIVDAAVENKEIGSNQDSSGSSSLPEEGPSDAENAIDEEPVPATAPSRVRRNRRAIVDSESEDEESSDDEDAATIAELKREAEALRADIKAEGNKVEIGKRKAENEDLRTQLATLRGEPAPATEPFPLRASFDDEESSGNEDAANLRIAELKREAEALRAEIKAEEKKKRKAEIVKRKAENEDLRMRLATLRGEPATATAPYPALRRRRVLSPRWPGESSGDEDAASVAELKGEAETLRAAIKAEGKKKRKAEIVKRKAENEDLRTQLAALRGEPSTSAGPSLKKAKR